MAVPHQTGRTASGEPSIFFRRLGKPGGVFLLRAEGMPPADRALLSAVARAVLPGELGDVQHVREHLLAGTPEREPDMCARCVQKARDRLGNGHLVPPPMELRKQTQRLSHRRELIRERVRDLERIEGSAAAVMVVEQLFVADCEQRASQRGEHR